MRGHQPTDAVSTKKLPDGQLSMKEIWDAAAKEFESICGESLNKGQVRSFEDVQKKIKSAGQASDGVDEEEQNVKWEKAKSVGLQSLKYLKMLVGAASQASSFIPIPEAAANITGSALCFVFDIPETIKGYNDAVNQVFGEVSSSLSQFHIYQTIDNANPLLIQQIHLVLVSFVKVCAYVVKYRQGRRRDRFMKQFKSIFDDDSGLSDQMAEFRRSLQQQRDVEGTVTLAVVVETQHDVAQLLEQSIVFGKTTQETHQAVQAMKDDVDRMRTLIKIRDTLGVPSTVRLNTNTTQTCNDIADKCLSGMGSWIWTHDAYTTWASTKDKDKDSQRLLLVTGPSSSGKTCVSALITKRLEEQKGRTFVAHYFFPSSTKKADNEKNSIQSALKYMAFQIARVDVTVQKVLGKACDEEPAAFRRSASLDSLDSLWERMKIGASGSNAVYYLVFDGIENLPDQQVKMLLDFVFSPRMAKGSAERVQILVSGTDEQFANWQESRKPLRIQMEKHNVPDMRIVIEEALNQRGMLQNARPDSEQQRARDKILDKLPQNVEGSYSRLQFGLKDVIRLLSSRTAMRELDRMLGQSMSSHEAAIKNLQRSLTADEISELNELLKWVLFSNDDLPLEVLEAAMFLYSETESLASLEYIIKTKYSAVLKLDDGRVFGQDGVKEYLRKDIDSSNRSSNTKDRATISMTITINNVDQELCGHFLWDLAHKAIRDKFNFNLDGDASNALHGGIRGTIAVDEFEAHHTIVTRAFEYLRKPPREQTEKIGWYLVCWLPYHLDRLRQLEDDDKGSLMPSDQYEIGQNLYNLFRSGEVFLRHKESFQIVWWIADEMDNLQKWLMDSAIMRRLDKKWRDEVQLASSPTRGYLKELVRVIIQGFLRERSWGVTSACQWLLELIRADERRLEGHGEPSIGNLEVSGGMDWNRVSTWCQGILKLPDSELNSLWYERLATASASLDNNLDVTVSLYQRAAEEKDPSWLCYSGLGTAFYKQGRTPEAVVQVELALKRARQEDATPKPDEKDIIGLYLLLGQYAYEADDVHNADKYYSLASESDDASQAREGQLGRLKSRLGFPNAEDATQFLKNILSQESGRREMTAAMEMMALDAQHDDIVARMFAVAKEDTDLLKEILDAMERAISNLAPGKDRTSGSTTESERFAEDEARSVLLCDRGFAAYLFKISPEGTDPVNEALQLWGESRDLVANVGGTNALLTRQRAATALASHYFQSIVDGLQLDYYDSLTKLTKLADSDPDYNFYRSDSVGFLGSVLALCGKKESAKKVLMPRIKQGLQVLSDDILENDELGLSNIQRALGQYQDFKNSIIALSLLGQSDLVTDALFFESNDITDIEDNEEKQRTLNAVSELAKEVIHAVDSQVPDTRLQVSRIEAAKAYIDNLVLAEAKTEMNGNVEDEKLTAYAHRLIQSRILTLHQKHTPDIDPVALAWYWTCDGRKSDGMRCGKWTDFKDDFYHCIYCSNRDLCGDCLENLRNPESGVKFMECSAKHKWLQTPHQGDSMFVNLKANKVRVPIDVRPLDGDDRILKAYFEDGGEEITVEAWKEKLATEWGISPKQILMESSSESSSEDEKS